MPLYKVPMVRGRTVHGRFAPRVPFGYDLQPNRNWLICGDEAWLWTQDNEPSLAAYKIADDPTERLSATARTELAKLTSDRQFRDTQRIDATIFDLHRRAPAGKGWRSLLPSKRHQAYRLLLGPGAKGRNVLWSEPTVVGPSSKTFTDNGSGTGQVSGSAFAGSADSNTWAGDTFWQRSGGVLLAANITHDTEYAIYGSTDCDTDNISCAANLVTFTRQAFRTLFGAVIIADDGSGTNGYTFYMGTDGGEVSERGLYAVASADLIDSDSTAPNTGVKLVIRDGSDIEAWNNGSLVFSGTHSGESSGSGNRKGRLTAYSWGVEATNDLAWDDVEIEDLGVPLQTATPLVASVSVSGIAPAATGSGTATAAPVAASVSVSGVAPSAAGSGTVTSTPAAASVAISGVDAASSPTGSTARTPEAATVSVAGIAASAVGSGTGTATPAVASITVSAVAASAAGQSTATATLAVANVTVSAIDADAAGDSATATPDTASVSVAGVAASGTGSGSVTATPAVASITASAEDCSATPDAAIATPLVATVSVTSHDVSVAGSGTATATPGTATVILFSITVSASGPVLDNLPLAMSVRASRPLALRVAGTALALSVTSSEPLQMSVAV